MPQKLPHRPLSLACWLTSVFLICALQVFISAQQDTLAEPAAHSAKKLMLDAARMNSLADPAVRPWHLRASFQVLDANGKATDSGTYEEFWAAPASYKRTIVTSSFSQTDYGTDKGVFRSGRLEQPPMLINDVRREFVDPTLNMQTIEHDSFNLTVQELNGERLNCLTIAGMPVDPGRAWCLESDKPLLRKTVSKGEALEAIHDHSVPFQDRFIPGDLQFIQSGRLALTAHLDLIEPLDVSIDLKPTSEATLLHRRINISAGVAVGLLQKHDPPIYPADVKVSGRVTLQAIIGVDGHVEELRVISGPPMLQQAALDAVRHWTYRPFLLNNEPVEVMTQINIDFNR